METRTHNAGRFARGLLCHNLARADLFGPAIRLAYPARSRRIPVGLRIALEHASRVALISCASTRRATDEVRC
ncbi:MULTISPECIES: hypothetical protein [Burkholderia]|uniref:hypothetical protein n=1 Tax=Burkholderia TaxID=32008 RepID=UPI0008420E41|nr:MULTISPECIES: hypothetical protein [unclassified Burkholderia]AOK32110.1 hypothetical protein AQ611_21835 [Burkholderia sp. Bp7605]